MQRSWLMGAVALMTTSMFVGGCGDDDSASGPTLEELPPLLAEELCDAFARCFGPATPKGFTRESCLAENNAALADGDFQYLAASVEAGRASYHSGPAQRCLDDVRDATCSELGGGLRFDSCQEAIVGTITVGGDCALDEECVGEAFCMMGASCPGTCTAARTAGGDCENDDQCAAGLTCDALGSCTTSAKDGEICGGDAPECELGLLCAGADEEMNVSGMCKPVDEVFSVPLAGTCTLDEGTFCQEGLSCVASVENQMVTWECAAEAAVGGACKLGIPDQCPAGQFCPVNPSGLGATFEGTCQALPRAGQDCTEWQSLCDTGSVCGTDGKCHPINRIGGACDEDAQCASENCVDGRCAAPPLCML